MKLAVAYSNNEVETLGLAKSQNFGFSKDAEEMIFTMFTKNIYSNPIGSVVREITSNCFDSHKEAGVNEPVIVKLSRENNEYYISFVDVGVGMSPERITKVYAQYFNSTKRNDNNQIGGFGIGGKTPLAYAESFFLITVFNGVKYTYCIRKGTKSPVLDLLDKSKTTAHNGTTVKIPVRSNDVHVFEREINRQLYYFENVIFEGFSQTVKNQYNIIEGKNFLYRGNDYNSYAHICLGRVAYPIDFNVLEDNTDMFHSSDWSIPVAIKMEIGEINVTVSREAIDYTEETKKLIKKKLLAVKAELVGMLDKQHEKITTLEEYYKMEDSSSTLFLGKDRSINLSCFVGGKNITFSKLDALNIPTQAEVIHKFYEVPMFGKKGRRDSTWDKSLKTIENERVFLVGDNEEMPRKKNAYLKFHHKHFFALKKKKLSISETKDLVKSLTPSKSTTSSKVIFNQFRELQNEVIKLVEKRAKRYSSITVPADFRVSSGKTYNPNYELPIKYNDSYGFNKDKVKMSALENCKATIFYADLDSYHQMSWALNVYRKLFNPKSNNKFSVAYYDSDAYPVRFIMVAKSNIKYIAELKNAKPLVEFNKLLMRKRQNVMNAIEKKQFMDRYNSQSKLFINLNLFKCVDSNYAKVLTNLAKLKSKYDGIRSYDMDTDNGSTLLRILDIDSSKINYKGSELFEKIEETTEKNGMLKYVRIHEDFNPNSKYSGYNEKEIADILQLLSVAYVK